MPPIVLGHFESPTTRNPLGLKGLGEGGAIAPPAALANAINDALAPLGVEMRHAPVTPRRIVEAVLAARVGPERAREAA